MLKKAHDRRLSHDLLDQLIALERSPRDGRLSENELLHCHLQVGEGNFQQNEGVG